MAHSKTTWDYAKSLYSKGYSFAYIKEETGIAVGQLSKISRKEQWEKGKIEANRGFIYLIKEDSINGYYKIGMSIDINARLISLQCGNPYNLKIVSSYYTDNMVQEEEEWHNKFKESRINGEWFSLNDIEIDLFLKRTSKDINSHIDYLEKLLEDNNIIFNKRNTNGI